MTTIARGLWSQHKTHPDTKFSAQRRFITREGQVDGGATSRSGSQRAGVFAGADLMGAF